MFYEAISQLPKDSPNFNQSAPHNLVTNYHILSSLNRTSIYSYFQHKVYLDNEFSTLVDF